MPKKNRINHAGFSITAIQKRLLSLALAMTFIFFIILCRFFYVQVVWGKDLTIKAMDQWNREIPVIASRGSIYDTNGEIIVGNTSTYSVFLRPASVVDLEYTAMVLSGLFEIEPNQLIEKIEKGNVSELTIARQVEKSIIEKLVSYDLCGVYYASDNTRKYAYGDALCQTLGFISSDGSGLTGLEKYYDEYLTGVNGEIVYATDIRGIERDNGVTLYRSATDGKALKLTIDIDIQLAVEQAVKNVYNTSQAKSASCIVINPQNFEILALANYPSYDLNDIPRDDSETLNALTRNTLISDIYEPGSTFKVITAAANIEEHLKGNSNAFSNSYIFNSSRTRSVDGTTVKCWSNHQNGKHMNQTLADALNNSCNPCFTDIALSLGTEKFYEYLRAFNLGTKTGIDFNGEASGLLVPEKAVRGCDLARIGFGQTVAMTGIQLAFATAAAVNGGNYYTPRFLKSIISSNGEEKFESSLKSRVISEQASRTLSQMLEGVVSEGSGKKAYIEGYKVGGKTGTAQKYENGGVAQGKYISSFVGFFPSDKPQYLALIVVDEPQGTYYGSAVAAPVAKEIFQDIIDIKNIERFEQVKK